MLPEYYLNNWQKAMLPDVWRENGMRVELS